jgi:hypothetical protein
MRVLPSTSDFDGLHVTMHGNQPNANVQGSRHGGANPRDLEDCLEFQTQRVVVLTLDPDTYGAVIWVISQFGGPMLNLWLNAKTRGQVPRVVS